MPRHYLEEELERLVREDPSIFQWLQAGSLDGLWYWDLEQPEHEWMSPRFWTTLGYDPATKQHQPSEWRDLINPDDLVVAVENFNRHCADPSYPYDQIVRYRHREGSTVWVRCRGVAIRDAQGKPLRMLGAHNEISSLKEAEQEALAARQGLEAAVAARTAELMQAHAELALQMEARLQEKEAQERLQKRLAHTQKLESLGVLAGGIAHDFNNLLMAVLGYADLALHDLPPESPAVARILAIKSGAGHLADLTNQLLAYSGRGKFVVSRFDLCRLVADMRDLVEVTTPKNVSIRTDLPAGLPSIEGDASQIRQVLLNLLTNAGEAIGSGAGVVNVRCGVEQLREGRPARHGATDELPAGTYVFVEVSDTGSGMDPATRERIFDPFFTTKVRGRGLGLAAVLGIVRGHNGGVVLYSEPGHGTTFKVLLPAASAPGAAATPPVAPPLSGESRGKVLVIEDEEIVRELVVLLLEKLGFTALTAQDGRAGVHLVAQRGSEFCLVLLDLTMPEMGGADAFREISRLRPNLPVILSSGYNGQDATSQFAGKGLAGFIQKPFDFDTLRAAVDKVLPQ